MNSKESNPYDVFKSGINVQGKSPAFAKPKLLDSEDRVREETMKLLTQEPKVLTAKIIQDVQRVRNRAPNKQINTKTVDELVWRKCRLGIRQFHQLSQVATMREVVDFCLTATASTGEKQDSCVSGSRVDRGEGCSQDAIPLQSDSSLLSRD